LNGQTVSKFIEGKTMRFNYELSAALIGAAAMVLVQPQFAVAITPEQVNNIAKDVTVRIDGSTSASNRSGVIIERQEGNENIVYTVLTNWHVVEKPEQYTLRTPDDSTHVVSQIQRIPGADLAILQFNSDKKYNTVQPGNSEQLSESQRVYFAGYPAPIQLETRRSYRFITASITGRLSIPKDGYALVYDGPSLPGMSGGPVFDENGRLVAIHGEAESVGNGLGSAGNYGIPINTFFALQPQATNVAIRTTPTPSAPIPTRTQTPTPPPRQTAVAEQSQPNPVRLSATAPLQPAASVTANTSPPPQLPSPVVITSPRPPVVTPPRPTIVTFSPNTLPEYILPTNPNQNLSAPNIPKINELLQRENLTPIACTENPKIEIIGIQYTVCAAPNAARPAGRYEVRTGGF
jgi:S1-C subfamily serine protease